jgi:hypothetical protein
MVQRRLLTNTMEAVANIAEEPLAAEKMAAEQPEALGDVVRFSALPDQAVQTLSSLAMDRLGSNSEAARRHLVQLGALSALAAMLKSKDLELLRAASHALLRVGKEGEGLAPYMNAVVRAPAFGGRVVVVGITDALVLHRCRC